jgi:NADPH:quinone reductase-like Zn-dependent oxidoreductase
MKAMVVRKHGDVDVFELGTMADPAPGPGQVLVAVKAAGVNFADVLSRLGIYKAAPKPPFVPGIEVAGIVEACGAGVANPAVGDRVMAFCTFGGYAEKVAVAASAAMRIPAEMTFPEAAAFPVQYLTAYHGLFNLAHVRKGEVVLVHAAAGGVGIACLQLLKSVGAEVFATVGSDAKAKVVLEECAAARPIVYTREDFASVIRGETGGRGVDVVMDSVGGDVFRKSWNLLLPNGRHVLFGAAAAVKPGAIAKLGAAWRLRRMLTVMPLAMVDRNRTLSGFNLYHLADRPDILGEATQEILRLRACGAIRPRVGLSLPLAKAAEAHQRMQDRQTTGKIVLTVG